MARAELSVMTVLTIEVAVRFGYCLPPITVYMAIIGAHVRAV